MTGEPVTQAPLRAILVPVAASSETGFLAQAACGSRIQVLGRKDKLPFSASLRSRVKIIMTFILMPNYKDIL